VSSDLILSEYEVIEVKKALEKGIIVIDPKQGSPTNKNQPPGGWFLRFLPAYKSALSTLP